MFTDAINVLRRNIIRFSFEIIFFYLNFKKEESKIFLNAGDGIRTREETHSLGPQPSAFDRSTTPACSMLEQNKHENISSSFSFTI